MLDRVLPAGHIPADLLGGRHGITGQLLHQARAKETTQDPEEDAAGDAASIHAKSDGEIAMGFAAFYLIGTGTFLFLFHIVGILFGGDAE